MTAKPAETKLRPEIAMAWRRAALNGLDPGMEVRESSIADIDRHSRLSLAARPVVDSVITELADTRFSIVLTDHTSRIVDRRLAQKNLDKPLDRVLAIPGFEYLEDKTGTNSIATAHELQKPIAVIGDEHFLEPLKVFCCYGAPIIHPLTRRLVGVLDVTGPVQDSTPLLGPFVMRAVRDIQQRLLEGAREAEQRLLAEFQTQTRNKSHAVMAIGEKLVLSNPAAMDLVHNSDYAMLQSIASAIHGTTVARQPITLSSGAEVMISAMAVPDSPGGVLFDIVPAPTSTASREHSRTSSPNTGVLARVVLIVGEPGTGRTTTGEQLAGFGAVKVDAAESDGDDDEWLRRAQTVLCARTPVVIDNIHTLAPRLAARLTMAVREAVGRVILTSSPLCGLGSEQAALASEAMDRRELRPVRTYQQDFTALAKSVLRALDSGSSLGIVPSAVQLLAAHSWPGNIRELRAVLEHAARARPCGDIVESDLPPAYRSMARRQLTLMESAERDAILSALRAADHNRVAAAAELGISRTTLYDRIRRYHITD